MGSIKITETEFGTVTMGQDQVTISANGEQLRAWAHRPGNPWPCSDLADLDMIRAYFDRGGLTDLDQSPADFEHCQISGIEFDAWSSDVLRGVLPADHPAYFVTVGQFESSYKSRAARDAEKAGYGDRSYWDYLDQSAQEHHDYYTAHGDHKRAAEMLTRTLSDALTGNNGD